MAVGVDRRIGGRHVQSPVLGFPFPCPWLRVYPPCNAREVSGGEDLENLVMSNVSDRGHVLTSMVAALHERGFVKTECCGQRDAFGVRSEERLFRRDPVIGDSPRSADTFRGGAAEPVR